MGTNNPFRARLSVVPPLSPASDTNRFSFQSNTPRERPKSTNPFLDFQDEDIFDLPPERPNPPLRANSFDTTARSNGLTGSAAELFVRIPSQNSLSFAKFADSSYRKILQLLPTIIRPELLIWLQRQLILRDPEVRLLGHPLNARRHKIPPVH